MDAFVLAMGDMLTSLFAGLVVFAMVGFIAHEQNLEDITKLEIRGKFNHIKYTN